MKIIITENQYKNLIGEAYKWKPSASQRKAFAQKMQDPDEQLAYIKRKEEKLEKKRSTSKYDYKTAGGEYVPTKAQYDFVINNMEQFVSSDEKDAANMVIYGYVNNEKIHHDNIHIVNEKIRSKSIQ
jgi:hypothetical protein